MPNPYNMNEIANIKIREENGRYYAVFILYGCCAEKTGYDIGEWNDKRISKEKLDDILNAIKKGRKRNNGRF